METSTLGLEISQLGAQFTPLGLELPANMPLADWSHIGQKLTRSRQVLNWWIGDWAAFGERKYGKLKEFADANGMDYGRLRNIVWVSEAVQLSRRRDNLEWSFHQEVAALKPKEQDRWLEKASSEHLSVSDLRKKIRISKGETNALVSDGKSLEMGTKLYDDFLDWLKKQPDDFWTRGRAEIWSARLDEFARFKGKIALLAG